VLGKTEHYRPLNIFGFQQNREGGAVLHHRKLIRGITGAQGVASLNVFYYL
jgi:hypothetical protein